MEDSQDFSLTKFKIVFDNQILQISYDSSFEEYQSKTIDSVIEEVLNKIGPKPQVKSSQDYILVCSCGKPYNANKLLSQAKCSHYFDINFDLEKNKDEKFILFEKEKEEKFDKYLSNNEIGNILMKVTGAKTMAKLKGIVPNQEIRNFQISENLRNIIKQYYTKKERGNKIIRNSYELKYNQQLYNELLEFGIPSNKIKAALRMANNIKQDAILLATDESLNFDNYDYLFYDNDEVLSPEEFSKLCKKEIKKEFPSIDDEEEILSRIKLVTNSINNNRNNDNNNQDIKESDSSEEESESSSEDDSVIEDSGSNVIRFSNVFYLNP